MVDYKNIYSLNNRFYIKKRIFKKDIDYGSFKTKEEAAKKRDLLVKHDWMKCASTGYPPEERFPKYQLKKDKNAYLVVNKKTGKTYGSYKSMKYAKIVKKILPFYEDNVEIEEIEKVAHKEYFRYIHYNKLLGVYHVKYRGIIYTSTSNLSTALHERDMIVKCDGDEELLCECVTEVFDYSKDVIPEFFREVTNIRKKNKHTYQIEKVMRNEKIVIGSYSTYNLAVLIRDYLSKSEWDEETVNKVIKVTSVIHNRDRYIHKHGINYYIVHYENSRAHVYAKYGNRKMAMFIRNKLVSNNWNEKLIGKFERKYYRESYDVDYYYDDTDFFKAIT